MQGMIIPIFYSPRNRSVAILGHTWLISRIIPGNAPVFSELAGPILWDSIKTFYFLYNLYRKVWILWIRQWCRIWW